MNVSLHCVREWIARHNLKKTCDMMLACSKRRYKENNGFDMGSETACRKRMSGCRCLNIETNKGGKIQCHSSWEAIFAKSLDENELVASFSKDSIKIPYDYNGKMHHYFPDFMITIVNQSWIVEVKAQRLLTDARVMAKLEALKQYAKQFGFNYFILTGKTKINPEIFFDAVLSHTPNKSNCTYNNECDNKNPKYFLNPWWNCDSI